ncbi:DNA recombination protein RmuC [Arcobacter sp. KX21116]|jgi:DNA recombination protein RmuC|uniref:DNA recombination protein RmuC n=1 Tax=Arcobacter iocasae TaxID=2906515 RepID=UPI0035D3F054
MSNEILIFLTVVFISILITYIVVRLVYEKKLSTLVYEKESMQKEILQRLEFEKIRYEESKKAMNSEFRIRVESYDEKLQLLEDSKKQMKLEFESLANKLFEENSKKSSLNLNQVLNPFKEQLNSFGKRVNDIYNDETQQRVTLLTEIKNLKDLNNQISQDAVNLTKALKGENKTQGDWGEMILSKILEQTGLREGIEYSTQGSFTNVEGKRLRPDVIVHLPQDKDVIIDSKVSLLAYTNYVESEEEIEKEKYTKELTKSIYAHIKGLSSKNYDEISDLKTLDFVLLFIPIEGAFMLAASKDSNLFKVAFESNIMLVSPSTLFVTLRTIENIWRYEHQNENALIISKKAADLYDKFASFVKDIENIGIHIDRSKKSYDEAINKLSVGRGNLLRRAQEFEELGVKAKKTIDESKLLGE